ncbi:MAG: hypothetical protein ACRD0B_04245, partial [Acidimicrobiales bacterium]
MSEPPGEHLHTHLPAWRRQTTAEHRWQMALAVVAAIGLQVVVPSRLTLRPNWVMPVLEGALLIGLVAVNPGRIVRHSTALRAATLALVAAISVANAASLALLTHGLVRGTEGQHAGPLLIEGGAIWATNVIVFSFWYWEFDRGGPAARAHAHRLHADLLFPQMVTPEAAGHDWEATYFDYLYTSFTNAS